MAAESLTEIINTRINNLQSEITAFPQGGGFESLRDILGKLHGKIESLVCLMDDIEAVPLNK